jgi:hypothetical protein
MFAVCNLDRPTPPQYSAEQKRRIDAILARADAAIAKAAKRSR